MRAPSPVSDCIDRAEATFEISGADEGGGADFLAEVQPLVDAVIPDSTDVTERWRDADMSESMSEMSEDAAVNGDGQETLLDIIFDVICELAAEDWCDWVPVHQIQEQTSLRLWLLEQLFEEWETMGVICRDDTRLGVAFCPSVADALEDEY